jgi:hypothetical protein
MSIFAGCKALFDPDTSHIKIAAVGIALTQTCPRTAARFVWLSGVIP